MKTLVTPRLELSAWTDADADVDALFDIYSRWEVARYLGTNPAVLTSRDQAARASSRWGTRDDGFGVWAIRDGGAAVGSVLLQPIPWSEDAVPGSTPEDVEIGWHLHPDAWGRGFASEAASAVLEYARERGIPRVVAVTYPENTASQRVCERIGMTALGTSTRYYDMAAELFEIDLG